MINAQYNIYKDQLNQNTDAECKDVTNILDDIILARSELLYTQSRKSE